MDNLQYFKRIWETIKNFCFKPYYKWIIFNICKQLNIISGKDWYGF